VAEAIIIYANASELDLYVQFDDDAESPLLIQLYEGEEGFLRRYVATTEDLVTGGLVAGTYYPSIREGVVEYASEEDQIFESFDFVWDGTNVVDSGQEILDAVEAINVQIESHSGGGVLNARIAYSSLTPEDFLQIVQGEEKLITFIVEATGRFASQSCTNIVVKFADAAGTVVIKDEYESGDIERVTEELDVQILRCLLSASETASLVAGLLIIEIAFDNQKARLTHSLNLLEQIEE
jgi:hypothetical protein